MTSENPRSQNELAFRREIRDLIQHSAGLIEPVDADDELGVLALGTILLARELAEGVLGESAAEPPRDLNAMRLARHLWEVEIELHYITENPDRRFRQLMVREARNRLEMWRSHGPRSRRPPMAVDFERTLRETEEEGRDRDQAMAERKNLGDPVMVDDHGGMPKLLAITKSLGRKEEYFIYYSFASLWSHPGVFPLDSMMETRDGRVVPSDETTRQAAGMALSLTRTAFSRVVRRVALLRPEVDEAIVAEISAYLEATGIGETGVVVTD